MIDEHIGENPTSTAGKAHISHFHLPRPQFLKRWKLKITSYGAWACAIIVFAILIRVALIALGWPLLDSDEGTMGIMAMHIAHLGEHPIFFYAQGYMGATEAYLAASLFHFFGVSSFTLRLGLIFLYTIFLIAMYLLTSLLYSKKLALVTLVFLALGSNPMLLRELVAVGGDLETLMCGAILMLLAVWLVLSSRPDISLRNQPRRLIAYGAWGLCAGFAIFSHVLALPFIVLGGFILLLFCWRELKNWAPLLVLAGLFIGILPIIIYNIITPANKSTLFYTVNAFSGGKTAPHFLHQIKSALMISLSMSSGADPLCSIADVKALKSHLGTAQTLHCSLVHIAWPLGVLLLWGMAVILALAALWRFRYRRCLCSWSPVDRQEFIRNTLRLSLLVASGGTLLLYIASPTSFLYPVASTRYLIGLLIATPAVLWPLWHGVSDVKPLVLKLFSRITIAVKLKRLSFVLRYSILVLIGLVLLLGTWSTFTGIPAQPPANAREDIYFTQNATQHVDVPATQALNQREHALIQQLLHMHAYHIYSDYWTCNRVIFQSQEHIICAVLGDALHLGHNRYPPYLSIVRADAHATYVFHVNGLQDIAFERDVPLIRYLRKRYQRHVFDGYAIYSFSKGN